MAQYLISDNVLTDIAGAIRGKLGTTTKYKPVNMKAAINSIPVATAPKLENVTVIPTEQQQQIETTTGDYLGVVTVNAITATYVGSGVTRQAAKTIIPTKSAQTAVNANVYTTGVIAVGAIPNEYIVPSGTTSITVNGTVDVKNYAQVNVNVAGQSITLDTTAVSATEFEQTIYPGSGINGFSSFTVRALSTTHVGSEVTRQDAKTITPKSSSQTAVEANVYTTGKITVAAVPTETTSITTNGTYSPSSGKWFSSVTVNVPTGSTIKNQNKSTTPSSATQTLTADSGYTGLGTVIVNPIPSNYIIPSGNKSITANGSNIDVKNYATVSVNVTVGENSWIVKNSDNLHDSTEDVPNTYINGSTETTYNGWTSTGFIPVEPNSYYLIQGTPGNNYNAFYTATKTQAASGVVIPASPNSGTSFVLIKTNSNTYYIRMSGASSGVANYKIYKAANQIPYGNKSITENGNNINVSAYDTVSVNVPTSGGTTINNQTKTATPSESSQEITPDTGYTGLSKVTVSAITATYVGSEVTRKSSSDLTASGATINVPAGYYSTAASKSVATATQATPAITISSGGLITASATQTAGYVSAGTKTTTSQMTVKAATTYRATTSNQTIAAGTYLTGTQTFAAVSQTNLSAANIKAGTTISISNGSSNIWSVAGSFTSDANAVAADLNNGKTAYVNGNKITGTQVINKYYTGTSAPASSLGSNGDIYLQE